MQLSLPDHLRPIVEAGIVAGHYDSAEAYVTALIEKDRDSAKLEAMLLEGLDSGPATPLDMAQIKEEARRHL